MANIDFQYQLTPKGQELAREVSNETVKTTKKMMQKFDGDTINNFINGKSKSSQNKEYASSKTKNVKSKNNTASKIKPLPQGAEMIDMLNKIHSSTIRSAFPPTPASIIGFLLRTYRSLYSTRFRPQTRLLWILRSAVPAFPRSWSSTDCRTPLG